MLQADSDNFTHFLIPKLPLIFHLFELIGKAAVQNHDRKSIANFLGQQAAIISFSLPKSPSGKGRKPLSRQVINDNESELNPRNRKASSCRDANKTFASPGYAHAFASSPNLPRLRDRRSLIQVVPTPRAVANFPKANWRARAAKDFRHG